MSQRVSLLSKAAGGEKWEEGGESVTKPKKNGQR
jgi:hypothetical protein